MAPLPPIVLVIPVKNAQRDISSCLSASQAAARKYEEDGGKARIVVVDDASTDNTTDIVGKFDVELVKLPPPSRGPSYARNRGAELASSDDILVFADSDVLLKPDTLVKFGKIFAARDDVHAVFGSYDDSPTEPGFISQYKNLFHHYVHQTSLENSSSFWAGCGAIRKRIFSNVGGFPESYKRPAIEDIELGYVLMSRGYRTVLAKDIQVTHTKKWTFFNLLKTDIFMRGVPWTVLLLRTRSFTKDLNLQTHNRVSVVLVYLMLLAILLARYWFWMWASVLPLVGFIIYLNWGLYQFFAEKRGVLFAIKVFPLHLLYYIYNGISFWLGVIKYHLSGKMLSGQV